MVLSRRKAAIQISTSGGNALRGKPCDSSVASAPAKQQESKMNPSHRCLEWWAKALRRVYVTMPVTVEYELTEYNQSLNSIIEALRDWGIQHRARIIGKDSVKV